MSGYYIFCDESMKKGKHFSNFYGGLLVAKSDYEEVLRVMKEVVAELGLEDSELKWSNMNTHRLEPYRRIMEVFFGLLRDGRIKVRIMFSANRFVATNLNPEQIIKEYHLLYYQFMKHAFGLRYLRPEEPIDLEFFFDELPDTRIKNEEFKNYIYALQSLPIFNGTMIQIKRDSIYEVDSKKHLLMQCLDVVLGSIAFRLNGLHKEKPAGQRNRGKRTIAKEKLYKAINAHIQELRPNFNIGISTGCENIEDRFSHPYRHWCFKPLKSELARMDEEDGE